MEARLLFSADLSPIAQLNTSAHATTIDQVVQTASKSISQGTSPAAELVVIDEKVGNVEILLADIKAQQDAGRSIVVLQVGAHEDGIAAISLAISQLTEQGLQISAIHIISHGGTGEFELGSQIINDATLKQSANNLSAWSLGLTEDADILIYGCNFASDQQGINFSKNLAAITGADIAGNTDKTGDLALGGDWSLDFYTGAISATLAISDDAQGKWHQLLSITPINTPTPADSASLGSQNGGLDVVNSLADVESTGANKIAVDSLGNYCVAWLENGTAKIRFFDATGVARPGGTHIIVPQLPTSNPRQIAVAMNGNGDAVATWVETMQSGNVTFARLYSANGTQAPEFLVSAFGNASKPAVAMNDAGEFVIAWQSMEPGYGLDIRAQAFTATGNIIGVPQNISANGAGDQIRPSVAMSGNTAVVAWRDTFNDQIAFRTLTLQSSNVNLGTEILATPNITPLSKQDAPAIAISAGRKIVLTWQAEENGNLHTYFSRYQADANFLVAPTLLTGPQRVNPLTTEAQSLPKVAIADDGSFLIAQQSANQAPDLSGWGVFARVFSSAATPIDSAETSLNLVASNPVFSAGNQFAANVAWRSGNPIASWSDGSPGNSSIYTRQLAITAPHVFTVTTESDVIDAFDGFLSLPEAIIASNLTANVGGLADKIIFEIPVGNFNVARDYLIELNTALPSITEAVEIDGESQYTFNGGSVTVRDVSLAASTFRLLGSANGLDSSGSSIKLLNIQSVNGIAIVVESSNNEIANNYIYGGQNFGIQIDGHVFGHANNNKIRDNTVFQIQGDGISIYDGSQNTVSKNSVLENALSGIEIASSGLGAGSHNNEIVGNTVGRNFNGILLVGVDVTENRVRTNYVGVDKLLLASPNRGSGILINGGASDNVIGGSAPGEGNTIAKNGAGITVSNVAVNLPTRNSLLGNLIFNNATKGISVDPLEAINAPVLLVAAQDSGSTFIASRMVGQPLTHYRLEFFSTPKDTASVENSGRVYLGAQDIFLDASGSAFIRSVLYTVVPEGNTITATATITEASHTDFGSTSNFSSALTAGKIITILENTTPSIDVSNATRFPNLTGLTYAMVVGYDSPGIDISPGGILSISNPQNYEGLIADYAGSNDNELWVQILVSKANGDTDTLFHIIRVLDQNDSPAINTSANINAPQGSTVSFSGPDAITISDPDSGPIAVAASLELIISATIADPITGISTGIGTGTVSIGGSQGQSVTINGTIAELNTYLAGLQFITDPGESRSVVLSFSLNDNGSGFPSARPIIVDGFKNVSITPAVNVAPTISGIPPVFSYVENSGAIPIFSNATLANTDGPTLIGLTIAYAPNLITPEELFFLPNNAALGGLNLTHDLTIGQINISGQATVAVYQSLLRSIGYVNTSDAPGVPSRIFKVSVNDGVDPSSLSIMKVQIIYRNDAPLLSLGSTTAYTINYGTSLAFNTGVSQAMTISDPDTLTEPFSLTVSAPPGAGGGLLSFSATQMNLLQTGGFTAAGTASGDTQVTLTGGKSQILQALALLNYTPATGHVGAESISFTLSDLGNIGTGGPLSWTATIAVTTAPPINTAPTISGVLSNQTFTENGPAIQIFSGISIADAQQTNLTQATITTSGAFNSLEDFQPKFLSVPGGIQSSRAGNVLTLTGNEPIANYMAALNSLLFLNTSDTPSGGIRTFTVQVFDGALWSAPITTNVAVVAVDDPTQLSLPTSQTVGFGQLLTLTGQPSDLFLTDLDAGNTVFEMYISAGDGSVYVGSSIGGPEVRVRGTISDLNNYLQQQQVTYRPNAGFSGTDHLAVAILSIDMDTGLALPQPAVQSQINVTVLAGTAPELIDASSKANFVENGGPVTLHPSLQIIGGNNGFLTSATVQISSGYDSLNDVLNVTKVASTLNVQWNATTGTLTLSNSASLADYTKALASLTFINISENPSDVARSVSLVVTDFLQASQEVTLEIGVESVNDAPTLAVPRGLVMPEDSVLSLATLQAFGASDVDGDDMVLTFSISSGSLLWIGPTAPPGRVQILGGREVILSGSSSEIGIWAKSFEFVPPLNFNGSPEVKWTLTDNQGASDTKVTAIAITPVNDLPSWQSNSAISVLQGQTTVLNTAQSSARDVEDAAQQLVYELSSMPSSGTLFLDGVALSLASSFTQADIDRGAISYRHNNPQAASDSVSFTVRDREGLRTSNKTLTITVAATPVVVITPSGSGNTSNTGGSGNSAGPGTIAAAPISTSSGGSNAASKSVDGADASTNGSSVAAQMSQSAGSGNSANKTNARANTSTPGASNSGQAEGVYGNSSGTAASARSVNPLADNNAAARIQSDPSNAVSSGSAKGDQLLGNGLIRTRSVAENIEYAAIQRAVFSNQAFTDELQNIRDKADQNLKLDKNVVASTTAVSATLSIGYVIWLVRGGALLSSLLTSIPAWRMVDPLPVLGNMGNDDSDVDDDSLDAMIEKAKTVRENGLRKAAEHRLAGAPALH